ncbi:LOW QUALITY PROTEIN: galectin-8-like [Antechinus flavipes]|uniref:LOW QUALITY PROTEIN: galectin-8-like n=1 Tax=Antechinus flavipes TaxID=38775 RepID=UPI0022357B86|nr:LOW QUALITY PROTEIN: galectin-8-like [Antechinus flavipes]
MLSAWNLQPSSWEDPLSGDVAAPAGATSASTADPECHCLQSRCQMVPNLAPDSYEQRDPGSLAEEAATSLKDNIIFSNNPQHVIHEPMISYFDKLSEELRPGNLFVICGHVPHNADRFQVDFQCGNSVKPRADMAFHFNPGFKKSGHIVCNALIMEKWGWEEVVNDMPFEKGKDFQIMFMVLKDKFQMAVNLLLYKHRIKPDKIDTLGIYGKIEIESIEFHNNMSLEGNQATCLGTMNMNSGNISRKNSLW